MELFSFWSWLALGALLLILEVFGAGGYLLWIGMAAAAVGVLKFLIPGLPWEWQVLLFAVFSILTALYWWRRQRSVVRASDQPNLNLRGQELIGKVFVVTEAIVDGRGKIKVADGVWMARGPDAASGSRVRVIGQQGAILLVERAD
ncbi:membrane protein implicated in regulation of membrane protease activity [Pseudomonas sp. PvR086]|jgi:membrane protein implicated in regulation of membrane protease activity|uniref:NfeD family protein n=1 Tax=Pseudomonas TaxID=286 RepID=UPI000372A070|nr:MULTISPECIES: NfeD family protein [Pseudomonas]MBD9605955.1 NfeD family protein [Pseudomonas sp. PDM08]MDR7106769.1 membrane protein implicated in regulation of membrane protease activity [Pseudomonas frederiksbergensis]PMY51466.1 NfeD family protein [Pseudomonas sp. FW305-53]PMY87495.1 NfeD family protein [Pseudomonas sp. FW303-C2]PMY94369.1 NfeD family protein [Pseudomonas sp. FW305-62]